MPPIKKCVKCELHDKDVMYTGGHVRICPYKQCPCEECQEHDQLLVSLSRERRKRKEIREKRRAEGLLSRDIVKQLRDQMVNRSLGEGGFIDSMPSTSKISDVEPIVLSSDTEGFISDVDDYKDLPGDITDVHGYMSDELPDPEDRSILYSPPDKFTLRHSIFNNPRRGSAFFFTPPRPLVTKATTPLTTPAWSPTPSSPSLLSSPSTSRPVLKTSPVLVTLSSDSEDMEQIKIWGEGRPQSLDCHQNSTGAVVGVRKFFLKKSNKYVDEIISIDELLNDSMEDQETEDDQLELTRRCIGEDAKHSEADKNTEPDNNNNELSNKTKLSEDVCDSNSTLGYDHKDDNDKEDTDKNIIYGDKTLLPLQTIVCKLAKEILKDNVMEAISKKDLVLTKYDDAKNKLELTEKRKPNKWDVPPKVLPTVQSLDTPSALLFVDQEDTPDPKSRVVMDGPDRCENSDDNISKDYFEKDIDYAFSKLEECKKAVPMVKDISINDEDYNDNKDHTKDKNPTKRPSRWDVPPAGLTPGQYQVPPPPVYHVSQILIPNNLKGLLVGKGGHFIRKMQEVSGTTVTLGPVYCTVKGSSGGVEVATRIIQERLHLRMF